MKWNQLQKLVRVYHVSKNDENHTFKHKPNLNNSLETKAERVAVCLWHLLPVFRGTVRVCPFFMSAVSFWERTEDMSEAVHSCRLCHAARRRCHRGCLPEAALLRFSLICTDGPRRSWPGNHQPAPTTNPLMKEEQIGSGSTHKAATTH